MCISLEQLAEIFERKEAALPLKEFFYEALAELSGEKRLAPFANRVRKRMCMKEVLLFDGDTRMVFEKSGLMSRVCCFILGD